MDQKIALPMAAMLVSLFGCVALGEEVQPASSPSPGASGGKNVKTKIEQPKRAKAVGVQAQDPTQNGKVDTSGALSPINANSMGVGVRFDLSKPKKTAPAPKKADSNAD